MEKNKSDLILIGFFFDKEEVLKHMFFGIEKNLDGLTVLYAKDAKVESELNKSSNSIIPSTSRMVGIVEKPSLELKDLLSFNKGSYIEVLPPPFIFECFKDNLEEIKRNIIKNKEVPFYVRKNKFSGICGKRVFAPKRIKTFKTRRR